jgi:hypothetical protein
VLRGEGNNSCDCDAIAESDLSGVDIDGKCRVGIVWVWEGCSARGSVDGGTIGVIEHSRHLDCRHSGVIGVQG